MSRESFTSGLGQSQPAAAQHTAVGACTINSHETDISRETDIMNRGSVSQPTNIPLLNSHNMRVPSETFQATSQQALNSIKSKKDQKIDSEINFSISSILNPDGVTKTPKSSGHKEKSAFHKVQTKRTLSQEMQLDALIDSNTGQMSRTRIRSPEPKFGSNFRHIGSNSRSVSLPRKNLEGQQENTSEKSETFMTVPPGFDAAVAAAAVAAATADTRTVLQHTAHAAQLSTQGQKPARKDGRIGIDHYPTTNTVHYTAPIWHGVPPPPPHQMHATPPQLPPSSSWYRLPPLDIHEPAIVSTFMNYATPMPAPGRTKGQCEAVESYKEVPQILVGYKKVAGKSGHKLPITMDARSNFRVLPAIKTKITAAAGGPSLNQRMAQNIENKKTTQRPMTATTPALVGPLRVQQVPPMPPLQRVYGQCSAQDQCLGGAAGNYQGVDKDDLPYHVRDREFYSSYAPLWQEQACIPPLGVESSSSRPAESRPGTPHPQLPPPPPMLRPPPAPTAAAVQSKVMCMTSQMAAMKSDHTMNRTLGKEDCVQASNVMSDRILPELIIAEPDIGPISVGNSENFDNEDHILNQDQNTDKNEASTEHFKAQRLSSLQLKTAKAFLNKEMSELEHKTGQEMSLDTRTKTTPYSDFYVENSNYGPLFLSSYIMSTPGCYEIYICKACNKEIEHRQNFRSHHKAKSHLRNLEYWIRMLESNNCEDQVQNEIRIISRETIAISKQRVFEYAQLHNHAKIAFLLNGNKDLNAQNVQDEETPVEVIHHPHQEYVDLPRQIVEQDFAAFTKASLAIRHRCPPQFAEFRRDILMLLSKIYFDRNAGELQLHFDVNFYDVQRPRRHWIPEMFETIKRRPDPKEFIKQNVHKKDLSFAYKTQEQTYEIRKISSMARLLFQIFLDCHFIPKSYLILLATVMTTSDVLNYEATTVCLNNGMIIDLLLQSGVAIFKSATDGTAILQPETEVHQDKEVPHEVDQAHIEQEPPNTYPPNETWQGKDEDCQLEQTSENEIFTSEASSTTFLSSVCQHVDDETLLNQARIQDDIAINIAKNATKVVDKNDPAKNVNSDQSSVIEECNMYQNTSSSYSSSSSIPDDIAEEETINESDNPHAKETNMEQETEIVHEDHHAGTLYVPDLPSYTTKQNLSKLFEVFGPLQCIDLELHKNKKFQNASITFQNHHNAKSAMSSLNGTLYKNKKLKIKSSKNRSFLASKKQHDRSPLENMSSMVQTMTGEPRSHSTESDTETEGKNPTEVLAATNFNNKKGYKRKLKANKVVGNDAMKASRPNFEIILSTDQPEEQNDNQTEFEAQCNILLPPNPRDLAQYLFHYWEEQLNFYEDMHRTKNGAFIIETINELAILAGNATPYRAQNN